MWVHCTELAELPRCSKRWWKLSGQLLDKTAPRTSTPSLKPVDGHWLHQPALKAQLFADTFAANFILPDNIGAIDVDEPHSTMHEWIPIRRRWAARVLKQLRLDQATGQDHLPARIFQPCWQELIEPATKLTRRMMHDGIWLTNWKLHWLSPLHKRGAVFNPDKYRGLNLTTVLSKVVGRILARVITPFLFQTGAYGRSQWAFQSGMGCKI